MSKKIILLNEKNKNHHIINLLFFIFIFVLIGLSFYIKTFDTSKTIGIIKCDDVCEINLSLPYSKVDMLTYKDVHIKYHDSLYEIEDINYDEPFFNNDIPYQNVRIITNLKSKERIINFDILYNKQRIIEKIKKLILER